MTQPASTAKFEPDAPYTMKEQDKTAKKLKPTTKSYNNRSFLNSKDARIIRILC